jgi:ribosome biogenesis GTP-binding protein YsxC/EngB
MYRVPSLLLAGRAPTRAVAPLRCHLPCGLHFSTTKRRPTISESLSAGSYAIPPRQPQASNASKKAAPEPVDPATANFFEWRKMPQSQKWAHLGTGAFPLVPARESQYEDQTEGMHLAHGVAGLQRLFMEPATIHRIVGFESDLYEESKRDSTATAEVAFVGRSNVGKSSLMNALLLNGGLRKQLATTSKTPGRTQLLFMFSFKTSRDTRLVDCPGYGFAKASKGKMETWNVLMGLYLRRRNRQGILKRVMVLIDVRRGIGPLDEQFLQFLESEGIAYQIVLTKCDLMTPRNFRTRLEEVREHLRMMPAGKFTTEASKRDYESQQQTFDAEEEEDEQWQRDVNSGKYAVEREITRGNSDSSLPDFSCCVPVIHAVSSRHEVGLETLQQSLTMILTL